jgi:hypothetical protein
MTIGGAMALIAVGAILKWAVTVHISGFDLQTAGTVLFIIGLCALPLALLWTFWWPTRTPPPDETRVMRQPPPPRY